MEEQEERDRGCENGIRLKEKKRKKEEKLK